jgi:hypothetical protein
MGKVELKPAPTVLFAFDPGKATGWTVFVDGIFKNWGISRGLDKFDEDLDTLEEVYGRPTVVVAEDFRLFRGKALQQSGSKMEASQVLGMLQRQARKWKAQYIKQSSNILPIAVKWSKMPLPSNHANSHNYAAYNHGFYYLVKNNMAVPVGMEDHVKKEVGS